MKPRDFPFAAEVGVRWSDMDAFGHVNHARIVTMLEEARIQWLLDVGQEYRKLIMGAMIVDVHIRYQSQLRHEDSPLHIGMWIAGFRTVEFTLGYEVRAAGAELDTKPACRATTKMAVVDVDEHRLRRLDDEEKELLTRWSRDY
ncbi:acyl-CoA thioesterase [Williamsia sterculiae]|uniref:Acyl-CoA thioester hydrolase n=1 Tax=Williamsia sterculiae TaxID=1344003 RepID=A0A1N7FD15_9NOCA|nr:thioesterase family protein [Williamsia sterculiae]SIR98229.1 acyl-CoA thioester hydrolase [Williamsia sterculiae]